MLTAGRPEKLGKIYLCKIISRQRGNFYVLGPETNHFANSGGQKIEKKVGKMYLCKIILHQQGNF